MEPSGLNDAFVAVENAPIRAAALPLTLESRCDYEADAWPRVEAGTLVADRELVSNRAKCRQRRQPSCQVEKVASQI
jgi:hypothetical protein